MSNEKQSPATAATVHGADISKARKQNGLPKHISKSPKRQSARSTNSLGRARRQSNKQRLTQKRLRRLLDYNPATGIFTWRVDRGRNRCKGKFAGTIDKTTGYRRIEIDGVAYPASRLSVLWMKGSFPAEGLVCDHIDRNRSNDQWQNLRVVTIKQNGWNREPSSRNKSGFVGVCWNKQSSSWTAFIGVNSKQVVLGHFEDFDRACNARIAAEIEHYGKFSRMAC